MMLPKPDISCGVYLIAAAGVLLLPLNWLLSATAAAFIHECGHIAALKLSGVRIFEISIGAFGAKITTAPMKPIQELICAAAGPLCSLLLVLFSETAPVLAMFGLFHGIFNLLPIFPMDGGRILKAVVEIILEKVRQ